MFEKMKGLTPKKKVEYYVQYYGLATVLILVVLGLLIHWVIGLVTRKSDVFSIIAVNGVAQEDTTELDHYIDDFLDGFSYNKKKYQISTEANVFVGENADSQSNYYTSMKLSAVLGAKTVDVVLCDDSYAKDMATFGAYADIRDFLPEGYADAHKDDLILYHDEDTNEDYPVGVKVNPDSKFMKAAGWYQGKTAYIYICYNRMSEDNVYQQLIKDVLEE